MSVMNHTCIQNHAYTHPHVTIPVQARKRPMHSLGSLTLSRASSDTSGVRGVRMWCRGKRGVRNGGKWCRSMTVTSTDTHTQGEQQEVMKMWCQCLFPPSWHQESGEKSIKVLRARKPRQGAQRFMSLCQAWKTGPGGKRKESINRGSQ